MMEGNLVIDVNALSKLTGEGEQALRDKLDKVKNCQLLSFIHDGKLVVLIPDANSTAVQEANEMYERFISSVGTRKE